MVLAAEVLLGAFILVLVGALATGRSGGLEDDAPDAPPFVLPTGPLRGADLSSIRLPLAVRGYRMAEVDALLDRVGSQLEGAEPPAADEQADLADRDGSVGASTSPQPRLAAPAPPGVARQLLGVCMAATASTTVVWALAAAGHLPTLLAVLASLAALLILPVLWPVYGGASARAGGETTVDVPSHVKREGSGHG